MLGIILLLIALLLYPTSLKRWSLFLFIIFAMQGLRFIPEDVIGTKYLDLAFVYMAVINVYSLAYERDATHYLPYERFFVWGLLIFLLCSAAFSIIHYDFSFYQVLQGGRHLFIFAAYFFLRKVPREDVEWLIKAFFYLTVVHATLYIVQCLTHLPVLLVSTRQVLNYNTGEMRYYNYSPLMTFYLLLSLLQPAKIGSRKARWAILLLTVAIILTQGRTYLVTNAIICLIGLLLRGHVTRIMQWTIIGGIAVIPFIDAISARFTESNTESDITQILRGDFKNNARTGRLQGGTLTYRFAWVTERYLYLKKQPLGEKMFGLGMISDSQTDVVNRKYQFVIGLSDKEHGVYQLYTPDIAWGNFITRFGGMGTALIILLWISLGGYMYKLRHLHPYMLCGALYVIFLFIGSIADSHISDLGNLVFPLLLCTLALAICLDTDDDEEEPDPESLTTQEAYESHTY